MFNMSRVVKSVIDRIIAGKIVPVKKEHKRMISEELTEKGITFSVSKDKVNPGRVFFRATVNSDK